MTNETYRIADEPEPSSFAKFATNPFFPLLALMLVGVWIAIPWFWLNAFAIGSPTRRRECVWLIAGFVAIAATAFIVSLLVVNDVLVEEADIRYAFVVVVVCKLTMGYVVYVLQSRTIEIFEYYGGVVKNGAMILVIAWFVDARLDWSWMPALWRLVLL